MNAELITGELTVGGLARSFAEFDAAEEICRFAELLLASAESRQL